MKYPIIPAGEITRAVERRRENPTVDIADLIKIAGKGPELELPDVADCSANMRAQLTSFINGEKATDRDLFEGSQSPVIHDLLEDLPLHVLDDPGFWAWLSVEHFLWLAMWREEKAFEGEAAKWLTYLDGRRTTECVTSRMFLRGQICKSFGHPELAGAIDQATDFWRSHIIRVSAGSVPSVAGAFIRHQATERMATTPLRAFARRLNRLSTNLVLDVYDDDDAAALVAELADG